MLDNRMSLQLRLRALGWFLFLAAAARSLPSNGLTAGSSLATFRRKNPSCIFLIEPAASAGRRFAVRIGGLMNYICGGCCAIQGRIVELFWSLDQFSYGSLMRYSRRLAGAFLGSEARGQHPADIDEVIGNDSQTHPAMHARVTFIEAAAESVASLEHADAPFAADAPFLSLAEPPLPFGAFDAAHFGCP